MSVAQPSVCNWPATCLMTARVDEVRFRLPTTAITRNAGVSVIRSGYSQRAIPRNNETLPSGRRKNPVHPLRQVAGTFDVSRLIGGLLGNCPAVVARAVQCVHDRRPVRVAVEQ